MDVPSTDRAGRGRAEGALIYAGYELLERLAHGPTKDLWKARARTGVDGFEKSLAIKRFMADATGHDRIARAFVEGAKRAVHLSHANIVHLFDLGRADDMYFVAMEYVNGPDLGAVLTLGRKRGIVMPPAVASFVAIELAKALDYAHRIRPHNDNSTGILHGAVAPWNVLLSVDGDVKLGDFGTATTHSGATAGESGVRRAQRTHVTPEQLTNAVPDARADVFSLAVLLYEMVSNVTPFFALSSEGIADNIRAGRCAPLADVSPSVPVGLAAIVSRAMHIDRERRYPDMDSFHQALAQLAFTCGWRAAREDLAEYLDRLGSWRRRLRPDTSTLFDVALGGATVLERRENRGEETTQAAPPSARTAETHSTEGQSEQAMAEVAAVAIRVDGKHPDHAETCKLLIGRQGGIIVDVKDAECTFALFGGGTVGATDATAAVRCALKVARATYPSGSTEEPVAQVAVHTGQVAVDPANAQVRSEQCGDLFASAQRLLTVAQPGQVLATTAAKEAVAGRFTMLEVPDEPLDAHAVMAERTATPPTGPFMGRDEVVREIIEVLASASAGYARIVAVAGEAGIGKSRVLREVLYRVHGLDVGTHHVSLTSEHRTVAMSGCREWLTRILGIEELDPKAVIASAVTRLRMLGLGNRELEAVKAVLDLRAQSFERRTVEHGLSAALTRIASNLAKDRLTVFAFDGMENMDEESQLVLDRVIRSVANTSTAFLLGYRPEFVDAWADVPGHHRFVLGTLDQDTVVSLTEALLSVESVPMPLLNRAIRESGGNPLYVEEYLRMLLESGAIEVGEGQVHLRGLEAGAAKSLPALVADRLERFDPSHRHVLARASVIGNQFTSDVLREVAGSDTAHASAAVAVSIDRGIVQYLGSGRYKFSHGLVRDLLMKSLSEDELRGAHAAAATALSKLFPQHEGELAGRLAHHHEKAGNQAEAARFLVISAGALEAKAAQDGAIDCLMRAIAILERAENPDYEQILQLFCRIADLSFWCRDLQTGADRTLTAVRIAEEIDRRDYVARFCMLRGRLLVNANEFIEGRQWLQSAREIAGELGDQPLQWAVTLALAEADNKNGEYRRAMGLWIELLGVLSPADDPATAIRCLIPLSLAYAGLGWVPVAHETLAKARALAEQHPDRYTECELLKTEGIVHYYARDLPASIEAASKAVERATEYGFHYEATVGTHNVGEFYMRQGDFGRAYMTLQRSYDLSRRHGFARLEMANLSVLGYIDSVRGTSETGRQKIGIAADFAADHGYVWDHAQARLMLAHADFHRGDKREAERGFANVVRMAEEIGNRRYAEDAQSALEAVREGRRPKAPS